MATLVACQKNKNDKYNKNVDEQYYDIDKILDDLKDKFQLESSPITRCCVLGDTNTGKTMLCNSLRGQQIGAATYIPPDIVCRKTNVLRHRLQSSITGLLLIDAPPPGHESFNKLLRSSQIAVLVVNINCGLQSQTIDTLHALRSNNINFVIAINKVDTLYGWKTCLNEPIRYAMMLPSKDVQHVYNSMLDLILHSLRTKGSILNCSTRTNTRGELFGLYLLVLSVATAYLNCFYYLFSRPI